MVDWKQSLPQIIGALIGSSLLVSGLSYLLGPVVGISVDPYPINKNTQNMSYTIAFKNIGHAPATHLRLTMSYPDAKILRTTVDHEDENMSVKNESRGTSVVAFLPRLTPGASISIDNKITRSNVGSSVIRGPLVDYNTDNSTYVFRHHAPYSIVATYDQGRDEARLSEYPGQRPLGYPYGTEVFESSILIVLAFLSFAIVVRRRRKSQSKFASDILTDVTKVLDKLNHRDNHKTDPNAIILRLHAWKSNIDKRHFVEGLRDYQKIDDFYSTVRKRNCYLLGKQVDADELNRRNQDCVSKATTAHSGIDWRKFHKLDLVLLIPAIVLGTLLMDAAVQKLSIILTMIHPINTGFPSFNGITIYEIILNGISSFFIIRLILKSSQGVIIDKFGLPPIYRSYALLLYCFVIIGIIPFLVNLYVLNPIHVPCIDCRVTTSFIVDIGSMFLVTWLVWRRYMKHKVKRRNSEIGQTNNSTNQREFKRSPI